MALSENSALKTESLVLTKDQSRRLREIRDARKTPLKRVTLSDVAREVVEAGLASISYAEFSGNIASDKEAVPA